MIDNQYTWEDYSDVETEVYANTDGTWSAKVSCISDPSLSTHLQTFSDEPSASHWARKNADRIMSATINELRILVREIILSEILYT